MSDNNTILCCAVNVEWLSKQGTVERKFSHKKANLHLIRNDRREIFIEIAPEKLTPIKLQLKNVNVHKKFMNEGKACIKFLASNCTLYLSNAPPGQLLLFLKTIFIKMTGEKDAPKSNTPLRNQILSGKLNHFEEISPVTNLEADKASKKINKSTDTTPSPTASRKRKLEKNSLVKAPAAKRLYTASPTANEPLNEEQKEILDACLGGRNIFFTGSAGTGKSYLLKKIIGALPPDVTVATASTGVAACQIGGITLHQFAGIGAGEANLERCVELASKPVSLGIWRKCKHLIIDEVSMIDGKYFQKIEEVARRVRRNEKPFGGIQLILCGDFFQLPPVNKFTYEDKNKPSTKFCFQTQAWQNCGFITFELKKIHRQSDEFFISILNKIRMGRVDESVTETLLKTATQNIEKDGILATRLCSHTKDADIINETKLKELSGESRNFEAQDSVPGSSKQFEQQTSVPTKLELKVGAQVMLLKNINVAAGLVNGARGVIKGFRDDLPVVQFKNKREYIAKHEKWMVKSANGGTLCRKQIPLKLAWAFSIHKSQGLTLDCVEMSLGRVFEAGQAYVALSRAQSLQSLRVLDFKAGQVWANPDVLQFYKDIDHYKFIPLGTTSKTNNVIEGIKKKINKSKLLLDKPLVSIS